MHKIKPLHFLCLLTAFWLLMNLCRGAAALVLSSAFQTNVPAAFLGVPQFWVLVHGKLPAWLFYLPCAVWAVPAGALLLYHWLRKPTPFKAFLLAGLGPYVGCLAFIDTVVFILSLFWTACWIVAGGLVDFLLRPRPGLVGQSGNRPAPDPSAPMPTWHH